LDQASETADDAAHALTVAALLAAPFTSGASLEVLAVLAPIQAASSLYRIVDRGVYGNLQLDAELIGDFINVASFGLGGVGSAGRFASRGVQIVAGTAGVAVRLLNYGNYVVIAWSTFRALTTPDPPGSDPREGRQRRLIALLSALEAASIPVAEHMWPPGIRTAQSAPNQRRAPVEPSTATERPPERPPPEADQGTIGSHDRPATSSAEQTPRSDFPELRRGLPSDLAGSLPITREAGTHFGARSVHVEYTTTDGVISDIRLRVGREVTFRQIAEHVSTIRSMQRYQGLSGRARALIERITAWFVQNPRAGPGTRAWEARLELAKLPPIIEARAREMADPSTGPRRRAELDAEIHDLERQLAEHSATVDSLASGRGFVAAEGLSAGREEARRRNYPDLPSPEMRATDGTPLGEYIWRYQNGELQVVNRGDGPKLIYEPPVTVPQARPGRFVPDVGVRIEPSFGAATTRAEAYAALGGRDSASEFGRFTRMLIAEGIAPNHEALIAMMQDPAGLRYRTVRSNLKDGYAHNVVSTLTDPLRLAATPLYSLLLHRGMPRPQALLAVSHAEMLRITRNLYSSDRGTIAETWYAVTSGEGQAIRQVTVTPEQARASGTSIGEERRLDRVVGSTIEELKNVSGPLDPGDRAQINDQLRLVGIDINVSGRAQHIDVVRVVFLDPQGVLANARYMYERLAPTQPQADSLNFQIYSQLGTSMTINSHNRAILIDLPALHAFVRSGKTP
jgi:hypothetical protein